MKLSSNHLSVPSRDKKFYLFFNLFAFFFFAILLISPYQKGHCAQITLTWDPNSEPDLAGYEIYYGTSSGNYQWNIDVGNVSSYTLTGLNTGITYYAAATAYNTTGMESGYSNEVIFYIGSCSYTISPSSASFPISGGSGSVTVTTQAGCNWSTSSSIPWLTVTSGSGMGSGTMTYTVSPNTGATRTAVLTIAGNVFTVTEAGLSIYTITASAGVGGSISPAGLVSLLTGAGQTFTITPNTGYQIANVTVDGVFQGAIASYTFSSVNANHSITATFSAVINTPLVTTGSATSVTLNSATLNGMINPNGSSTTYVFEWGTTAAYGNTTAVQTAGSGTSNVAATANLTNLTANTLYHYRLVATNGAGTSNGAEGTFIAQSANKVDFNNDWVTDILWRNKVSGDVVTWTMNGTTLINQITVSQGVPLVWEIAGTGDFNNDGQTDILWRNTTSGDVRVWLMNGTTISNDVLVYIGAPLVWEIVGTGDFTNDGRTDILWRHKISGDLGVWTMNGTTFIRGGIFYRGAPQVWEIAGSRDFNEDGKPDILWRNTVSGDVRVWLMNGTTLINELLVYQGAPLVWEIAGTGDFTGDGKTDILWRHKTNGAVGLWTMNGTTFVRGGVFYQEVPLEWLIVAP
ncbi:MAG: FG-GAP repeat protein [Deltaproteobacteria bacterium]|nr:FG-GAP repeat protein [Deltaproteobacteria bacterium]